MGRIVDLYRMEHWQQDINEGQLYIANKSPCNGVGAGWDTTSSLLDKVNLTGSNDPYFVWGGGRERAFFRLGFGPWLCGFSQGNLLGLEEGKTVPFYRPVSQWVLVKDEATGSTTWDFNAVPSVLAAYSG